jgi:hypothetical protein
MHDVSRKKLTDMDIGIADGMQRVNNVWWVGRGWATVTGVVSKSYQIFPRKQHLLTFSITYLLTYSIEQSPSWEAFWFSARQEIPRILWNTKVHYRIHKCPYSLLSELDPVNIPISEDPS